MADKGARPFRRILLKISGEALAGGDRFGVDRTVTGDISRQIREVLASGMEIAVVVGGGNIWRGSEAARQGMDRATADQAGMLATLINALVLQDSLEKAGVTTRTQSAVNVQEIAEPFIRRRAIRHLEKGRAVIFAAGTGNPYMTTDTAAALRAIEIGADVMLMAKNRVDGVYDGDPRTNSMAKKYRRLTYGEALQARLEVMDPTALSLCLENNLITIVFDIQGENSIVRAALGEDIGTRLTAVAEGAARA